MEHDEYELALDLMVELRKEIIEAQRIRAQVVGFKITFVSASIGLILANSDMSSDEVKQNLSLIGNLGITILAVIPALLVLVNPFQLISSLPLIILLFLFVSYDIYASFRTTNILVRKKVIM